MSKGFMNKRKKTTAVIAVVMTFLIIFGGTFAWQSISQEALNEVSALRNPGGRLHDDFNDITEETNAKTMTFDKNVYVENFTTLANNGVQIFARIRLDEYMEFGDNAGALNNAGNAPASNNKAESLVYGAELADKTTWTTHVPGNADDPFHKYWDWTVSSGNDADKGVVTYMPTFNKNKDSLQADINGTFDADFNDYVDYTQTTSKDGVAVYDNDDNLVDEIVENNYSVDYAETNGFVTTESETHTSKESLTGYVITMDEWIKLPANQKVGNFWVWDNDGWAYWANPIDPESATGLFLDGISRTETIINEDWYYGINVVAQFVTKEDLGKENGTGFYDTEHGVAPSSNALVLLNAIGVDVNTTVEDGDATGLKNAMNLGGNITVNGTINGTTVDDSLGEKYSTEYAWTTGGNLIGGELVADENAYAGLFINAEKNYPKNGDTATEAVVNKTKITGNEVGFSVYAQAIDANIILNEAEVTNTWGGGIYADHGDAKVILNGCTVTLPDTYETTAPAHQQTAVAAAGGANVVINDGTYTGNYAAYVYSSGGTITINDGTFKGKLAADAGKLVIKGGSFSADPTAYLAEGYTATHLESGMWEVK